MRESRRPSPAGPAHGLGEVFSILRHCQGVPASLFVEQPAGTAIVSL